MNAKNSSDREPLLTRMLSNERGILLVSLVMVFAVAAVFVAVAATRTAQDHQITTIKTENLKSFYAAQAGEQAMLACIRRDGLARFAVAQAAWSGTGPILTDAAAANFFASPAVVPGARFSNGSCFDTVVATIRYVNSAITVASQVFNFEYTITSIGTNPNDADQLCTVLSNGNFQISVDRMSFANYALFTNTHLMLGGTQVWFTSDTNFTGRVHTNGRFCFAFNPTFSNGLTSSVSNTAYYYNRGNNRLLAADSNPPYDIPVFGDGLDRGADAIALPPNSFDQRAAAVGGDASNNSELRESLGLPPGGTPPPNGIYIPNDGSSLTAGIYVQGSVSSLRMYVDSSERQCYRIVHTNGTTTNVTVDYDNNQTTVGGVTYSGTPNGAVYVAGNINSLAGPNRSGGVAPPAIQSRTAATVISEGDVVITRDIVYEDNPLTDPSATNVFGIFTPGGDIRIGTTAPDDIVVHSTLMTSASDGVVQVDNYNYGHPRGTATILGGVISSYYGAFGTFNNYGAVSGYARSFVFDRRLSGGIAPPYFPTTPLFNPAALSNNRLSWSGQREYDFGNSETFNTPDLDAVDPGYNPIFG